MATLEMPLVVNPDPAELPPSSAQPPEARNILAMEAQIKAASDAAQAKGEDPSKLPIGDLAGLPPNVPEKFVKPTGEVDVEKLKASTKQLDEAIQKKEQAVQKSVEDYLQAEAKFRTLPNPAKLEAALNPPAQASAPAAPPQGAMAPPVFDRAALEARINADIQANPAATVANLIDIMFEQKFGQKIKPLEEGIQYTLEQKRQEATRANLRELAAKDPRILNQDVFDAVNAKLQSEPKLWELKNPHKAAWLEVKEEMRLGEAAPNGSSSAQPSRPLSPILGGGTPPPLQSSASGVLNSESLAEAMKTANFKDKMQVENLDKAMKALSDEEWRRTR